MPNRISAAYHLPFFLAIGLSAILADLCKFFKMLKKHRVVSVMVVNQSGVGGDGDLKQDASVKCSIANFPWSQS